jgi:hypothetical protein
VRLGIGKGYDLNVVSFKHEFKMVLTPEAGSNKSYSNGFPNLGRQGIEVGRKHSSTGSGEASGPQKIATIHGFKGF